MTQHESEADTRIAIDDLLGQAGWDPADKSMVRTEVHVTGAAAGEALARYALDNLPKKVLAAEYRTTLPDEKLLAAEIEETRRRLEGRGVGGGGKG